jgi:hypothetical protein
MISTKQLTAHVERVTKSVVGMDRVMSVTFAVKKLGPAFWDKLLLDLNASFGSSPTSIHNFAASIMMLNDVCTGISIIGKDKASWFTLNDLNREHMMNDGLRMQFSDIRLLPTHPESDTYIWDIGDGGILTFVGSSNTPTMAMLCMFKVLDAYEDCMILTIKGYPDMEDCIWNKMPYVWR